MNYTKTFFCTLGVFTLFFLGSTSFMIGTGIETEDTPIHFADENLLNSTAATNNVMIPDSGYSPKPDDETIVPKDRVLTVKGYDTCEMERPGRIQISKKQHILRD